jgi:hypothetical protein
MKHLLHFFITILFMLASTPLTAHSLVFIHIGGPVPAYCADAIAQARLFNPDCPCYLLTNQTNIDSMQPLAATHNVQLIAAESLNQTEAHTQFLKKYRSLYSGNFWRYTSERFLYLNDFIQHYHLTDVFHLENDVMLYTDLNELLPIFKAHYPGIGAVSHNDQLCIPGFVYVANKDAMAPLAAFFAERGAQGQNDMDILGAFRYIRSATIHCLPCTVPAYVKKYGLRTAHKGHTTHPDWYLHCFKEFNAIFDGAAFGQYLGGAHDKKLGPGFVNQSCMCNPSHFTYEWRPDDQHRKIPYAVFDGKAYRINNLHIHCKNLKKFAS